MDRRSALKLAGVGVAAAALGAMAGIGLWQTRSGAVALQTTIFPDLEGNARRLRDWQGHRVVVNFWATWCAPCVEEMPLLQRFRQQNAANGIEVVGIGIDRLEKLREFAARLRIEYPLLVGDMRALDLMRDLGNLAGALPFTVVVDSVGVVTYKKLGVIALPVLQEQIDLSRR